MSTQSLYDILGILETASPEEVKEAHRRKIRTMHPDTGGSEEAAKQVNAAYEVLSDPTQRAAYDRSRRAHALVCPLCDKAVASDDHLMAHIIRHRAEIAAAQRVAQEATRRANEEQASQARQDAERTTAADQRQHQAASHPNAEPASDGGGPSQDTPGTPGSEGSKASSTGKSSRKVSNATLFWFFVAGVIAVIAVAAALGTGPSQPTPDTEALPGSESAETAAPTTKITSTTRATSTTRSTGATTTEPATTPPAGATWAMPAYDGSVLLNGSVSAALPNSQVEYRFLNDDSDLYLMVDGAVTYNVVDGLCLDTECSSSLRYMIDGPEFVWVIGATDIEGPLDLSDGLHFTAQREGEFLSACWSESFAGPVVAIVDGESGLPSLDRAWVFVGEPADGTWFGLEPSLIDPESVLVPPFSFVDWQMADCGTVGESTATGESLDQPPASVPLFDDDAKWGDELGVVSDAMVGASIAWEDLNLVVNGELTDLSVISGWCAAPCDETLTYAVPNNDFQRYVWFMMSPQSGASPALGLELTADEVVSHGCWSTSYDAAVVYTADSLLGNPATHRAWVFEDGESGLTWYLADPTAIDIPDAVVYDGNLTFC